MLSDGSGISKPLRIVSPTPSNRASQIIWPNQGRITSSPRPLRRRSASMPLS